MTQHPRQQGEVVQVLLVAGAAVDKAGAVGRTALIFAAFLQSIGDGAGAAGNRR